VISAHPEDLERLGISEGRALRVASRRGELVALARADRGLQRGEIFIPFCYREAAANLLTNAALDPFGKIAEVKYCAVKVNPA
jgi:formate dehydrogenase major subunit